MVKKVYLSLFFGILGISSHELLAFELMQVTGVQTEIVKGGTFAREEAYSTINNPQLISKVIAPSKLVKGYIPFNRQVGTIHFSVLSPKKTILHLEWDNKNSLYPRRGRTVKFRRAGQYQSIVFNATKPSLGYIYIYNSGNKSSRKLLKKIPYQVAKQRAYNQSIRMYANKQGNTSDNDNDDNEVDISLSYSINQRVNIGEPRWSAGARVTTDKSIGVSVGYSW